MRSRPIAAMLITFLLPTAMLAEDIVVFSSPKEPGARLQKSGTVVDFTGKELTIKSTTGREETLPTDRVLDVQTTWPPGLLRGEQILADRRPDAALTALREAKKQETRPWVVRRIMARLVACYAEMGRFDLAGDEFIGLATSDPETPHFEVIPLAWKTQQPDPALDARAKTWLKNDRSPVAQLLGASWLLPTADRPQAVAALEKLASAGTPRIALLAESQLWRVKLVTANDADISRWQQQIERMPWDSRATAWFTLGAALARRKQHADAALAYLHTPLEYSACRWIAPDALVAAGKELQQAEQPRQASLLYREVVADFRSHAAATEAGQRLKLLEPK